MIKKIFLVLFLCFTTTIIKAQWVEYFQNESIKIEYLKQECNDIKNGTSNIYVFLKITNKTSETIDVYYNIFCNYQNGNKSYRTKGENIIHTLRLPQGQSAEGNCDSKLKNLKVYAGSMKRGGSALKEFEVTNIEIKRVK